MKTRILTILLFSLFLAACTQPTPPLPTVTPTLPPTATLPDVQVMTTSVPDAEAAARAYLEAWLVEDYPAMYAMLTPISQDAINEEDFAALYSSVASEAALSGWEYEILSSLINPRSAQMGYRVTFHSVLVGDFSSDTMMSLSLETGQWLVQWDDALIMRELGGGNHLSMEYRIPSRANIYSSDGSALVAQSDAVAIGLDTGQVGADSQGSLISLLSEVVGYRMYWLADQIDAWRPYGYYLPVADVSADAIASHEASLAGYSGVILSPFRTRYYFNEGTAPHIVGYMSLIQPDEVDTYRRLGYRIDERVGRAGLEYWGEEYLAGQRGGALYVVGPDGSIITQLAATDPQPAQAVYTTIDYDLQLRLQQSNALSNGMRGAVVVMERETGRVLAMLSSPGFNPNLFEPSNYNYQFLINDLYGEDTPLLNRATQGAFPLGSVFKVITMSAGLESGLYPPETIYNCEYFFKELPGIQPMDWTYQHFLDDGETQASGPLTLPEGLMRSCNPWFQHIGLGFYQRGMYTMLSDMARAFGLGSPTGIEIGELAGAIPDPVSEVDAINLAIGQGGTLVTPVQVASFIAAVGNGGTLYGARVIERVEAVDGTVVYQFEPVVRGTLPISEENLLTLQAAMVTVIMNPRGTAYDVTGWGARLTSFVSSTSIGVAAKTGTAESGSGKPHAWFAGYTFDSGRDRPDIAVAVIVENGGEGSQVAAPIFRRVLEVYYGFTLSRYPWESSVGVLPTDTPEVTEAPPEEATETPAP